MRGRSENKTTSFRGEILSKMPLKEQNCIRDSCYALNELDLKTFDVENAY